MIFTFVFILLIIFSLVSFVYFKVQQTKSRGPMEKRWYSAKASIAIGIFFISFSINSYISLQSTTAAIILVFFVLFGGSNVYFGIKQYKHHLPFARREVEELNKSEGKPEK